MPARSPPLWIGIHYLLELDGLSDDLFKAFLVYLVSHNRPPHELLDPHLQDLSAAYKTDFVGMTVEDVPLSTLIEARERLVAEIIKRARADDARAFLISVFSLEPDWARLGLEADVAALPAVLWKMRNLHTLRQSKRGKFDQQLAELKRVLAAN
jgi:hypothetical protein